MKQAKTMAKRNNAQIGLCAALCVLLLTVAGIFFGTSLGTPTSAKAAMSTKSGLSCAVAYHENDYRVAVALTYKGSDPLESFQWVYVTFKSGSRSWNYTYDTQNGTSNYTFYIPLSGNEFFAGGCEYSVYVVFEDAQARDGGYNEAPHYVNFGCLETFSIPGEIVPLPDPPIKEGYHFVGWYYDEAFTHPYDGAPIYADTALYAKMEINTYTVTYDTDCDVVVASEIVEWNTAASMPTPTRKGYVFIGWFMVDGTQYNGESITQDITLTAQWEVEKFTVTFYLDGEVYTSLQVPYGSPLGNVMTQAKVAGYRALDTNGVRVSLQSAITEDTQVLIHELSRWEKYGDFVVRNHWYTWLTLGVVCGLLVVVIVGIVEFVKRGK